MTVLKTIAVSPFEVSLIGDDDIAESFLQISVTTGNGVLLLQSPHMPNDVIGSQLVTEIASLIGDRVMAAADSPTLAAPTNELIIKRRMDILEERLNQGIDAINKIAKLKGKKKKKKRKKRKK